MVAYQDYKGYGITYSSMTGDTVVDNYGFPLKIFARKGQMAGLRMAKDYIDKRTKQMKDNNKPTQADSPRITAAIEKAKNDWDALSAQMSSDIDDMPAQKALRAFIHKLVK